MGFYAPAQIVRDAREHGVEVRGVDVNRSQWDCTLEDGAQDRVPGAKRSVPQTALRLGMRLVRSLREDEARALTEAVGRHGSFDTIRGLRRASGVRASTLRHLASADAFGSMGLDRQAALWEIKTLSDESLPLFDQGRVAGERVAGAKRSVPQSQSDALPPIPEPRKVIQDYAALGLSLKAHPVSFIRPMLERRGAVPAAELRDQDKWPHGAGVAVGGMVLVRQRPGTASGIVFMTLEDETGVANLIVRPHVYQRDRQAARHGVVVLARGTVERQGDVVHILVRELQSADRAVQELAARSRDFH
jgi:error-prone DNA polymerase